MKISEITGPLVNPRGEIEFDEVERDRYVARFLAAFDKDCQEDERARLVHAIHSEICSRYDLYIAVNDAMPWRFKTAIRTYVTMHGNLADTNPTRL